MSDSVKPSFQVIDEELIERTLERARNSPRQRSNHNFHASHADGLHRFLNAFVRGTYAAPHRHVALPKPEAFVVLRGELAVFVFDDAGVVSDHVVLGREGVRGIDIPAGVWHTLAPVTPEAVAYEVKPGPWDPATDKEFARFAPLEGEPGVDAYLAKLMGRIGVA
jgi:cupin fold WbuC family metalloprotein